MRLHRSSRAVAVAAALTAATALAAPAAVHAAPVAPTSTSNTADAQLPIPSTPPKVDQRILDSLGAFAPALVGSITTRDSAGKMNKDLLDQARQLADNPALPTEVRSTWTALIDFLGAPGAKAAAKIHAAESAPSTNAAKKEGAPNIPRGRNAPRIQQFLYPTLGFGCMPGGNSVGMALVTAGPQQAPAPGPKRGQAGYVYTSLGTGPAVKSKRATLVVNWINIDNGRTGVTTLRPNPKINATKGPGTFTGIATTGRGRVISTISGTVTTKTKGRTISCGIAPTIGIAVI